MKLYLNMQKNSLLLIIKTNRLLLIVSMGLGLYLIYGAFIFKEPEVVVDFKPIQAVGAMQFGEIKSTPKKDFKEYAEVFKKRDFFGNPLEQYQQREKQPLDTAPQTAKLDLNTHYKLVGIVLDGHSQAIVEDMTKKETLFLSVGDNLGDAVLKEIQQGKVILLYGGQLLEFIQ